MKPSIVLQNQRQLLRELVAQHHATNPRVFGSVARGQDEEGSDIDILIDPTPATTLFDIGALRHALSSALNGIPVDVLTPNALPRHARAQILAEAVAL